MIVKFKILMVIIMAFFVQAVSAQEMLADMDIPLMAGLYENYEEGVLFDSPDGRIINAQAQGSVKDKAAFNYYNMVLPSLGWEIGQSSQNGFSCEDVAKYCIYAKREGEVLTLNFEMLGNNLIVKYVVSPH